MDRVKATRKVSFDGHQYPVVSYISKLTWNDSRYDRPTVLGVSRRIPTPRYDLTHNVALPVHR